MSIRTTSAAVIGLLGRDYDHERKPSMTVHVTSASVVVDRVVAAGADEGITVTATEAELVERWLAAYVYTLTDPTYKNRSTLSASGAFNREADAYLRGAKAVDPTGLLEAIMENRVATFDWLGKVPSEQTDYVDRD